jgi:hypothetical protein
MMIDQSLSNSKHPREQNLKKCQCHQQKTEQHTGHTCISLNRRAGNIHAGLPTDSNDPFSTNHNRSWLGILELRSGPQSQELELETLAAY